MDRYVDLISREYMESGHIVSPECIATHVVVDSLKTSEDKGTSRSNWPTVYLPHDEKDDDQFKLIMMMNKRTLSMSSLELWNRS